MMTSYLVLCSQHSKTHRDSVDSDRKLEKLTAQRRQLYGEMTSTTILFCGGLEGNCLVCSADFRCWLWWWGCSSNDSSVCASMLQWNTSPPLAKVQFDLLVVECYHKLACASPWTKQSSQMTKYICVSVNDHQLWLLMTFLEFISRSVSLYLLLRVFLSAWKKPRLFAAGLKAAASVSVIYISAKRSLELV